MDKIFIFPTIHIVLPQPFEKEEWFILHPQGIRYITEEEDKYMVKADVWKINYN